MENKTVVNNRWTVWYVSGWVFGLVIFIVGILNMFLVHLVPGVAYLLLSLVYLPPANAFVKQWLNLSVPLVIKIILGIVLIMFTLGVSDLGDMMDDL